MVKADIHTHTLYSHAKNTVHEMAEAGRKAGLAIYGFSEHSPRPDGYLYPSDYQEKLLSKYPDYINEVSELRRSSTPEFTVLLGLEVDFMTAEADFAHRSAAAHDFDYIIGGLHFQDRWGFDWSADDWAGKDEDALFAHYERYYRDLGALSESKIAHIIAHPDLIKLFTVESFRTWIKKPRSLELVRETLQTIAGNDQIMEISSAGLRKPCREIYPGPEIMALAAELKLPVCISSDAHTTGQIAYAFDELEAYARSFGYRESYIVRSGRPVAMPFD